MTTFAFASPLVEFSIGLLVVVVLVGLLAGVWVANRHQDGDLDHRRHQAARSAVSGLFFGCQILCNNMLIGWLAAALWHFNRLAREFRSGGIGRMADEILRPFLEASLAAGVALCAVYYFVLAQSYLNRCIEYFGELRLWEPRNREERERLERERQERERRERERTERETKVARPAAPPAKRTEPVTPQQEREMPGAVPALRVAATHVRRAKPFLPTPKPDEPPPTIVLNVPRRPRPGGPGRPEPSPNPEGGDPWPSLDEFLNNDD